MPVHIGPKRVHENVRPVEPIQPIGAEVIEVEAHPVTRIPGNQGLARLNELTTQVKATFTLVHNTMRWSITTILLTTIFFVAMMVLMLSAKGCSEVHDWLY